MRAADGSA